MKRHCDLFPEFIHNLDEYNMVGEGQRVLLAVSGGPDSMALLHLFYRWNPERIGVWHLNHGFRKEARQEAEMVRSYCESLGIPVEVCEYDVAAFARSVQQSKLHGARTIRYRLLQDFAASQGYGRIALGHHADDQAETVLMNLLRGTGLAGLKGMLPKRGIYIRPLLTIPKEDLVDYCHAWSVPFALDQSNLDTSHFRNRIRYELIPLLEREYNQGIRRHLLSLSELVRVEDEELDKQALDVCEKHSRCWSGQILFPRSVFMGLPLAIQRRVLRRLIAMYKGDLRRIDFTHIEDWRALIDSGGAFQLELPQTIVAGTANYIYVGEYAEPEWTAQILPVPGEVVVGEWILTADIFDYNELPERSPHSEDFDRDALAFPLVVRPRQAGDRMLPFGGASAKKVSRLMIEEHVPRWLRDSLPLITDQQDILWIPEVRRAEKGRLSDRSHQVVRITCRPG